MISVRHRLLRALPLGGLALVVVAVLAMAGAGGASGAPAPAPVVPVCPPSIGFGETIQCSIDSPAETDVYTFNADAGDRVLVRMYASTGTLNPRVEVWEGGELGCEASNAGTLSLAEVGPAGTCQLAIGGTLTLLASDLGATDIGDYSLHLQRLNNPGMSSPISMGETKAGSVVEFAQMEAHTFSADGGDRVLVRMNGTGGDLQAQVRLYDPDGILRCDASNAGNQSLAEIAACSLDAPGTNTYTILTGELGGNQAGAGYNVHLQRLNDPGNCTPIGFSETKSSTIGMRSETDPYCFVGGAGDTIRVTMSVAAGTLDPQIRLYDPDGVLECQGSSAGSSVQVDCTLGNPGPHAILVMDLGGLDDGSYDLHLACLTPPCGTAASLLGDVSCDGLVNVVDALFILQYEVGMRVDGGGCPLPPPPPDTLSVANCDVNDDGLCNVVDALFILQCEVGTPPGSEMPFCVAAQGVREESRL